MRNKHLCSSITIGFLAGMLCCACVSVPVYKSPDYQAKTPVISQLKEPGKNPYPSRKNLQVGEYDEYFNQISKSGYIYQLVYLHPGDLTADTNNDYIALVKIYSDGPAMPTQAFYNNTSLPVAVEEIRARPIENSFFVNIRLTRDQLIDAYENTGKMVISLTLGNKKYSVVFPDYYVRNVLAQTTNLTKYKIDQQIISATTRSGASSSSREPIKRF